MNEVTCAVCNGPLTPENAKLRPELFLHDSCLPHALGLGRYFPELVKIELACARASHGPQASLHEAYAVILEEVDELWDEVKKKRQNRSQGKILGELIQIAAMCQRAAEDLKFIQQQ